MNRTMIAVACASAFALSGCKKNHANDSAVEPDTTPVVHADLTPRIPKGCGTGSYGYHWSDAYKVLRDAEEFKPQERDWFVRELNTDHRNEYLLAGISPKERKEWFDSHKTPEKDQACLTPMFDAISAAAKRNIKNYHPKGYTFHDSSEEKAMIAAVKADLPDFDVLGIGVSQENWQIEKYGNGNPKDRYKYGMIWLKAPSFDDGYCRIAYVNVVQDYSGGGTYADTQGNYISIEPAGCP